MKEQKITLNQLLKLNSMDIPTLIGIFEKKVGNQMANHVVDKYNNTYDRNIVEWLSYLDSGNYNIIMENLTKRVVLDKFNREIKAGDEMSVQSCERTCIVSEIDGELYFAPYGTIEKVKSYLTNDIEII